MKRVITALLILGLLAILSGVSGVASISTGSNGTSIAYHLSTASRTITALYGVFLLFTAWGIHRRLAPIWRLAFFAIACCWIFTVVVASAAVAANYPKQSNSDSLMFTGFLLLVTSPVAIYWGYRWYKQRDYFYP